MTVDCRQLTTELGCRLSGGISTPVIIHYEYREAASGETVLYATRYTDADGVPIAPLPGDVFTPGSCSPATEFDSVVLCDPVTDVPVIVVITYNNIGVPTANGYNLDGTPYVGVIANLVQCPGVTTEADPQLMCDNGATTFIRWYVMDNGQPTGVFFDTDMAGVPYVPVGPVQLGSCSSLGTLDCAAVPAAQMQQSTCDRDYQFRTSGVITGAFVIVPSVGTQLRSWTLLAHAGDVTLTNGPDAGAVWPRGFTASFSAPNNGQGAERGRFPTPPAFLSIGQYIVEWVEG